MRIEILYFDSRCPVIFWFDIALPFFEIYFDTSWYDKVRHEVGIRFGSRLFEKRWGR